MVQVGFFEERYQLHVLLLDVGPAPWRRLLVRLETTIDELHRLIQLCMGWDERTWHEFWLHGNVYFGRRAGYGGTDPSGTADKPLSSFCLIPGERFRYSYGSWHCQIRLEKIIAADHPRSWPVCIGGKWGAPPEHCRDGLSYMNHRERIRYPFEVIDLLVDLTEEPDEDPARFRARAMRIIEWGGWMNFDRNKLNARLCTATLTWREDIDNVFSIAIGD